jgi:hypothetical protein
MSDVFEDLVAHYPAWWIDFLGEHNHIGGEESTRWLLERADLRPGARALDTGAFVGAVARTIACETGARAVATDMAPPFLAAGQRMAGGDRVDWVAALTQRLPFSDGQFDSVWCLDSYIAVRELSRVAAARATLCLCVEVPEDGRGGHEAFLDEWSPYGWELAAHKSLWLEATNTWRNAEAALVRQRPKYEERYGKRGYLAQLDLLTSMVRSYELREQGHALFVFRRG